MATRNILDRPASLTMSLTLVGFACMVLFSCAPEASAQNVTRGPYLQLGTPSSIVVRWRTNVLTDGRVRYGTAPGNLNLNTDQTAITTDHVVALSGLTPETTYYYAVGTTAQTLAGGDADHFFVTPPLAGVAKPTRVWVLGDSGTANANARAVRDAYYAFTGPARTDLWLMLGDNAYPDGTDSEYQSAVFAMYPELLRKSVLWPTLGNHDGHTADSATQSGPYYDLFTLPREAEAGGVRSGTEAYYSFDHGNLHFICLESYETSRSRSGAMLTWLDQDLLATRQDWVIAFWHHPPYSKGSHNSDVEIELLEMRENALPILEGHGVDLVLCGHSHSYERSFLIDGHYGTSATFTAAMKKDGGDGRTDGTGAYEKTTAGPAPHEGAVYVVAGSSGQTSGGMLNHPAMFISLNVLGSVVLDASGLELEVKFLDAAGVVRDYCTIRKGAGGSPPVPPSGLTATPVSTSRIDLAWVDGSVDETALVIERSLDGVAWAGHALLAANVVAYTDAGLQPATMYHYRVKARNGAGDSLPSNAASATTFAAGTSDQVAVSEAAVSGTVSGTFLNTWTPDGVRESIREIESGGRKSRRFSFLEHRWPFDLSPGSSATLFLKGHRTASTDGDNFVFAYSADGSSFTDLLTLTKTSDDGLYESAALPAGLSGTVIIRVRDSNRLPGTRARDTVHIDHLFIRSE